MQQHEAMVANEWRDNRNQDLVMASLWMQTTIIDASAFHHPALSARATNPPLQGSQFAMFRSVNRSPNTVSHMLEQRTLGSIHIADLPQVTSRSQVGKDDKLRSCWDHSEDDVHADKLPRDDFWLQTNCCISCHSGRSLAKCRGPGLAWLVVCSCGAC